MGRSVSRWRRRKALRRKAHALRKDNRGVIKDAWLDGSTPERDAASS